VGAVPLIVVVFRKNPTGRFAGIACNQFVASEDIAWVFADLRYDKAVDATRQDTFSSPGA
jgi:hypothetical protein